jgi:hypothetical protein
MADGAQQSRVAAPLRGLSGKPPASESQPIMEALS